MATLSDLRVAYHQAMHHSLFGQRLRGGQPVTRVVGGIEFPVVTNADSHNAVSVALAAGVAERLAIPLTGVGSQGSTLGTLFEHATRTFVADALALFQHLQARHLITGSGTNITRYAQFAHLGTIQKLISGNAELEAALGADYLVDPDILVWFDPSTDPELNQSGASLTGDLARRTPLRLANSSLPILHASISCKWTMRRDRAQNTRLEALNLVRNRKGRLPHIAAVTMECDPEILASLCLGTGDIDCVYHGALNELIDAAHEAAEELPGKVWHKTQMSLMRMVDGSRLRDISDLPPDLMI
jgi:hypothetical protein